MTTQFVPSLEAFLTIGDLLHFPQELPRFQELIFEDFSRFILVENIFEEVVLQSVMKDIITGKAETRVCGNIRLWA